MDAEGVAQVPMAVPRRQQGLRSRIGVPMDAGNEQGQSGERRHRPRDLEGLVEAPLPQPFTVQRHRHERIHP